MTEQLLKEIVQELKSLRAEVQRLHYYQPNYNVPNYNPHWGTGQIIGGGQALPTPYVSGTSNTKDLLYRPPYQSTNQVLGSDEYIGGI